MTLVDPLADLEQPPFTEVLDMYRAAGWVRAFPLPSRQKDPPPAGITGKGGTAPDPATLRRFRRSPADANIGITAPQDLLGVDADQYGPKRGWDNLVAEASRLGVALPATWRSTSRGPDNPSGIYWYRVPPGFFWRTAPLPGVELIAWHHRYAVAWPSLHPEGRRYEWYDDADEPCTIPIVAGDWPDLPWQLVAEWTRAEEEPDDHEPAAPQRADRADWHPSVIKKLDEYDNRDPGGSRHETAVPVSMALCRLEQFGLPGATSALDELGRRFIGDVEADRDSRDKAAAEWGRMLSGGRVKAQTTKSTSTYDPEPDDLSYIHVGRGPGDEPGQVDEPAADNSDGGPFVDWADFWATEHPEDDWLDEPWLARGRGHAIYAAHKEGKSLFFLARLAHIATTNPDIDVTYLDYEMSPADVKERLSDMGYGPDTDLTRFHYAFAPNFSPLDTIAGAADLDAALTSIDTGRHHVVGIDTMARAVEGDENSNDTYRAFYRWTGAMLRRRQATWARLDHAGKDTARGQRGASAKGDDVDVVWRLTAGDGGITLHRDVARMRWVPDKVAFAMTDYPLQYRTSTGMWPAGTAECANELDQLKVPVTASIGEAQAALKGAGGGRRKQVVGAAQKWRRDPTRALTIAAGTATGTGRGRPTGTAPEPPPSDAL